MVNSSTGIATGTEQAAFVVAPAEPDVLPRDEEPNDRTTADTTADRPAAGLLDIVDQDGRLPPFPVPWRHPLRSVAWVVRTLFGLASLTVLLAVIAVIPLVNFLALGYLLEVEGRIGRSGRLRDGFPLLNVAPRIGSIAIGLWLWLLPLRLLAGAASDAAIIDPGGTATARLQMLVAVTWGLLSLHLCLALARGGSPGCFVRPLKNLRWLVSRLREGAYFADASRQVRDFVLRLRLRYHFWLGLQGFAAALIWLAIPTAIFASSNGTEGGQILIKLIGGALLALTLAWVPFLQARLAVENRFSAAFALRKTRSLFGYAPLAWLTALAVVYVLALPLYLFKAFVLPREAMWPITLIFIASIYPARVMTGWAYYRAVRRCREGRRSHGSLRWTARLAMIPLLVAFVFLLHFTQFIGASGTTGLFEHHAFLLPWSGAAKL
jgi:hypothetical protein